MAPSDILIFCFFLSLDTYCHEMDVDYYGNDLHHIPNVRNWKDCQEFCKKETKCKYWSLDLTPGECWLKTSKSGRMTRKGVISGSRTCTGNNGDVLLSDTSRPAIGIVLNV